MTTQTTNFKFNLIGVTTAPYHLLAHANWHILDAVLNRYVSVSGIQGVWNNALAVTVGQRYIDEDDDTIWEVLVAHTTASSGTFSSDRTSNPTYWQSITTDPTNEGAWTVGTTYQPNAFITDSSRFGVVLASHTAETSYDQGVSDGNIATLIDLSSANLVIDTSLTVGHSAQIEMAGFTPNVQSHGTGAGLGSVAIARWADDAGGPSMLIGKSRGSSIGTNTIVQDGDNVGVLMFVADDGTDMNTPVASIQALIDGTPGENDMPGRLALRTVPDGSNALVTRGSFGPDGVFRFESPSWTANGSNTVTISNVAPAGVGTATISKWLTVEDDGGTVYYIPAWT